MQGISLPLQGTFYPLGFALTIATNSRDVLESAAESWSRYRPAFPYCVQARVIVSEAGQSGTPASPVYRAQQHLLAIVADEENYAVCDLANGFGAAWLTSTAVADRPYLRFYFLEGMAYTMLAQLYLTPIHAACVARQGRGVLLCGGPGAGKSSLAFTCARKGWTFLSDDGAFLVRNQKGRIVLGKPHEMRFRDTAGELIPELRGLAPILSGKGKPAIEIQTADLAGIATAFDCRAECVIFLNRKDSGSARLDPVSTERALERLTQGLFLYEPTVYEQQKRSLRNLLDVEAFELCYSDLDSAVRQLDSLIPPT